MDPSRRWFPQQTCGGSLEILSLERNPVIDGWRGLSVLLVIVGHIVVSRLGEGAAGVPLRTLVSPTIHWWLLLENVSLRMTFLLPQTGVQIFFIISGYLITSLLVCEEQRTGSISIAAFYIRRTFRIFPAFVCFLLVAYALGLRILPITTTDVAVAGAFLCNTSIHRCSYGVSHTWSLAVEEQFYLVWPILFVLIGSKYRTVTLVGTTGGFLTLSGAGFLHADWINNGVFFASISVGALYASSETVRRLVAASATRTAIGLAAAAIIGRPFLASLPFSHVLPLLTPFLVGFVFFSSFTQKSHFVHLLCWRPLQRIGLVSYSAYLWQQLFTFPAALYGGSWWPLFVLPVVATLSFFAIERPMIRLGHYLSDAVGRKKKALQPTTVAQRS